LEVVAERQRVVLPLQNVGTQKALDVRKGMMESINSKATEGRCCCISWDTNDRKTQLSLV
jgi:hypothetical protein